MITSLTEKEQGAIAACLIALGYVSANVLRGSFGIGKQRALELEEGRLSKKAKQQLDARVRSATSASRSTAKLIDRVK
jgi:hypothetical protein